MKLITLLRLKATCNKADHFTDVKNYLQQSWSLYCSYKPIGNETNHFTAGSKLLVEKLITLLQVQTYC
jgi:hypothetical protein